MKTLTPLTTSVSYGTPSHQIGADSRGHVGHVCLSSRLGSTSATPSVAQRAAVAVDASKAELWMNTTKFAPYYHFQRWRFAT